MGCTSGQMKNSVWKDVARLKLICRTENRFCGEIEKNKGNFLLEKVEILRKCKERIAELCSDVLK